MPVALSEWRLRIGTFIHRIKEWVVREMREELLKERIQRLRVLWKRLKAKKDDSEGGSQDQEARQDEVPLNSSDSSLVNPQGDCDAKPCTKGDQDSPPSSCAENVHYKPSSQKVTSQTDSSFISTPTHSHVSSKLCLLRPSLYSFLSSSFCFLFIFLLISSFCLSLSSVFRLLFSVSLSFIMVFPFVVPPFSIPSICFFPSNILHFSRRERSFGECHTSTASPLSNGSGPNEAVGEQLPQQPNLQELMLVTAGDVELNPGPREGSIDSALQDMELILLAKDVPGNYYSKLSIGLGFSLTEGQNVLTNHLFDIPGAVIQLLYRWKVKQKDGTDCRAVLGEILKETNMEVLQKRLLEGGYLKPETEKNVSNQGTAEQDMTEEQVSRCAEDLKSFYRERMCKIKPDPLAFDLIFEFEEIFTNLILLRNEMGITKKRLLEYKDLLTTKMDGVVPKRLLVAGEGGVGKTTLCSKIALDWANGSEAYNHFSWVLVIPLCNVIKGEAIGDIMKNYLNDNNNVSPEQIAKYMISHPSEILIILDGFDEYNGDLSTDETSDISRILRLEMFKQCTVLVTTKPWRADQIKCNRELSRFYCFISVEGFSTKNVSKYIGKFFANDRQSGLDLKQFIQGNDVIKENMAPFPIYVAMLCVLWKDIGVEKREIIRKLKTFSQLFEQMIIFLRDHYLSKLKSSNTLNEEQLKNELKAAEKCLQQIGSVAFKGLLERKLAFKVDDFSSCKDAMTTSCRIGILSREQKHVPRYKRSMHDSQAITALVFFPHKLFQEYAAAIYLASVYESDLPKYNGLMERLMEENPQEFRFLLYFTAAQLKEAGLDIVDRLHHLYSRKAKSKMKNKDVAFLVDVTFEAYHEDTAKRVGQWLEAEDRVLTINRALSAHTMSGYLFINEHHGMKILDVRKTILDSSTSHLIASAVFTSSSLTTLKLLETNLHDDFYKVILDQISKNGTTTSNVQLLCTDQRLIGKLHDFGTTIELVFPILKEMSVSTLQTISPVIVQTFAHANLKELSIERGEEDTRGLRFLIRQPIPLIGDPDLLGRLFLDSFPRLTALIFKELMIGNKRTESILQNLRKHQLLKSISIIDCFTDDELDPLAEQINAENRMKVTLQHNERQGTMDMNLSTDLLDALCHRTSVCSLTLVKVEGDGLCFPDLQGKEVDAKIHSVTLYNLDLVDQQSGSCCLGRFLSLLSRLTDLKIHGCNFSDDFYREIAKHASSSQSPYFVEKKHVQILQRWSAQKQSHHLLQSKSSLAATQASEIDPPQDQEPTPIETNAALVPSTSGIISSQRAHPADIDDTFASGTFGEYGGELSVKSYGFRLIIPSGALEKDEQIGLRVLTEIPDQLALQEDEILVSHGFKLRPAGLQFKRWVKLIIPHCAVVTLPNNVQTTLYSLNQSDKGEFEPTFHSSNMICSVQDKWIEVLISHFCGGRVAPVFDFPNTPFRGIKLSCMLFLPRRLPSTRRPVLQVKFTKKIGCREWRDIHTFDDLCQPAKSGGDDEILFRRKRMTVSCIVAGNSLKTDSIHYEDFKKNLRKTLYFDLDLEGKPDDTLVTLYFDQDGEDRTEKIMFNTPFQDVQQDRPEMPTQLASNEIVSSDSSLVKDNQMINQQININIPGTSKCSVIGDSSDNKDTTEESVEKPPRKRRKKTDRNPTSP